MRYHEMKKNPEKWKQCVAKMSERSTRSYVKNKEKVLQKTFERRVSVWQYTEDWKNERGCKDCGLKTHLTVDHLFPELKARKSTGRVRPICALSIGMLRKELENCECVCIRCHRIRTYKQRRHGKGAKLYEMNKAVADSIKRRFGCSQCGYKNPEFPCTLDFHHVEPTSKVKAVSALYGYPFEEFEKEILKCEILCANCNMREKKESNIMNKKKLQWTITEIL